MILTIIIIGIAYILFGLFLIVRPKAVLGFFETNSASFMFQLSAAILGVLFGILFYFAAGAIMFTGFFEIIGILAVAGGAIAIFIPPQSFQKLIAWELKAFAPYTVPLGIFEAAFGVFLIYVA